MQWLIDIIYELVMSRMTGLIVIWSGTLDNIPDGWTLCDGTNGTPDLTRRFVEGAGPITPPGGSGGIRFHRHLHGSPPHTHEFTSDLHTHFHTGFPYLVGLGDIPYYHTDEIVTGETDPFQVTGTTSYDDHIPPYYRLAYIMKI